MMNSTDCVSTKSQNQQSKTYLTFVLDERERENEIHDTHPLGRWHSIFSLFGILYTKIIVLAGIALPITEVLKGEWYKTHYVAAFYVYLYAVSIFFLTWFLFIFRKGPKENHELR